MQLHFEIPEVPHGHCLVSRSSGQDVLAEGVEGQAVDLSLVSLNNMLGLGGVVSTSVPTEEGERERERERERKEEEREYTE